MKNITLNPINKILITCPFKISPYLAQEVDALGFPVKAVGRMDVETEGTFDDTMKLNLWLRAGTRVLYLIKEFDAATPDELYKKVYDIAWENIFGASDYFSISSFVQNDYIKDTRFANLKTKDAIADRFMHLFGERPDSGPDNNKIVLFLHWRLDKCAIYIDTSGETIAKHGYRKIPFQAPMLESLAAAVIYATKWDKNGHFINPMCGSGTLAIEAALMLTGRAPGLLRSNFGFMHVKYFNSENWEKLRNETKFLKVKRDKEVRIIATDIDPKAIASARKNAMTAGVEHIVEFRRCDFTETPIPEGPGIVIVNPEYGERMGDKKELETQYEQIGDFFKQKCKGYTGYVFTGDMNLAKKMGLKTSRRLEFFNSQIECRLLEYELYEGTRRIINNEQ